MISYIQARRRVKAHIKDLHIVMFLDWDVSKPEGLDKAVSYLVNFLVNAKVIQARDLPGNS